MYTNLKIRAKTEYFSMCVLVSSVVSLWMSPALLSPGNRFLGSFLTLSLILVSLVRSSVCQAEDGSWKSCALGSQIMGLQSSSGPCGFCIYCGRLGRKLVSLHQEHIGGRGKWASQESFTHPGASLGTFPLANCFSAVGYTVMNRAGRKVENRQ